MLLEMHEKQNICEIFRPIEIVIFLEIKYIIFSFVYFPQYLYA